MALSPVATVAMAPSERSTSSRVDDATADRFAGYLAAAVNGPRAEAKAAHRPEGTSELDQENASDENETGSAGESSAAAGDPAIAGSGSANDVVRSLSALDPQLQAKLQRVAARVERETGHTVTVAETFRSQARQNALFAQGRQTAGPVVTWTQNSKHTQGRAVDVLLDGGNAGPDAYRALQQIAAEEGLQTLGARDPGHLELAGNSGSKGRAGGTPNIPMEPADATGSGQVSIARLAPVARVAEVRPATVAEVARPSAVLLGAMNGRSSGSAGHGARGDSQRDDSRGGYGAFGPTLNVRLPQEAAPVATVAPTAGSDAVMRAEQILSARDSAPARPLSHITMNVDAGNGTTDRVHLSLRGSALDTTIDTGDSRLAQVLTARTSDLSRALSRDGIELRELRVRAAAENGTVTAGANSQAAQSGADSSTQSRFDRGEAWRQQRSQQDQQDQQERHRSQQERGRQQQRQRRGGEE